MPPAFHVGAAFDRAAGGLHFALLAARIDRLITAIDAALTRQLNAIFAAPEFAALEARWRALLLLVDQAEAGSGSVIIRVLDASCQETSRSLERAADYDQSMLFRRIYDEEFGMPGGIPFGLIVADYQVSTTPEAAWGDQIEVLRRLAAIGAAAFCPVILGGAPALCGLAAFSDLKPWSDLAGALADHRRSIGSGWDALRAEDDSRFLGIVAPRIAIRAPYARFEGARADGFAFDGTPGKPLYANGAFAFASVVMSAFLDHGWFAAIRGAYQDAQGGGRVSAFQPFDFGTENHGLSGQPPAEIRFTSAQEEALAEEGIIPLSMLHLEASAVFGANPSFHRPTAYAEPVATQNARLAAMLQYVLCTSRFAHYLKVMMRDEIGSIADPGEIERHLTDWLRSYCLGNDDADQTLKAQYPLRDAGVRVSAVAGKPGTFSCTVRLQPHFQLDDIATSFHLIAETPARQIAPKVSA
ncbi:MAG: type VI secretion system contractile sheath large subunit [Tabrizicola sp.]|nr:type VI secretion system contractile sheath large subunit [Tabrizicola sp.]